MTERHPITVKRDRHNINRPRYVFDYHELEPGDWFLLVGAARQRAFNASRRTNADAQAMEFETEMVSERTMKITRIA